MSDFLSFIVVDLDCMVQLVCSQPLSSIFGPLGLIQQPPPVFISSILRGLDKTLHWVGAYNYSEKFTFISMGRETPHTPPRHGLWPFSTRHPSRSEHLSTPMLGLYIHFLSFTNTCQQAKHCRKCLVMAYNNDVMNKR